MLGEPFWNFVGGAGTYEELLEVYREVGDGLRFLLGLAMILATVLAAGVSRGSARFRPGQVG